VVAAAALVVVSHPLIARVLVVGLERQVPPPAAAALAAPGPAPLAMVVLSGAMTLGRDGEPVLSDDTLVRTVHAAEIYRRVAPRWVVVTGGPTRAAPGAGPIAVRMRDLLVVLDVPGDRVLVEGEARTTYENAVFTRRLLASRGVGRIVLVTEALHMPRAAAVFRAAGFDVTPAACGYIAAGPPSWPGALLPNAFSAVNFQRAAHEWIGLAWYWWRGYLRPGPRASDVLAPAVPR
jgi:uncharacterized SAM-binding protein YcdF (DUF218 family)